MNQSKPCTKCKETKPLDCFYKQASSKDGLKSACKACVSAVSREYVRANPEKVQAGKRAWEQANPEKVLAYSRVSQAKYVLAHPQESADRKRAWAAANKDKTAPRQLAYRIANKEKIASYQRAHYLENREQIATKSRAYNNANAEKLAARGRAYRLANKDALSDKARAKRIAHPEEFAARRHASYKANPEAGTQAAHKRRALKAGNGVFLVTTKELKRIRTLSCVYCGSTGNIHVDHVVPLAKGGAHSVGNLQPLCASCNGAKGDSFYIVFKIRAMKIRRDSACEG